jgi:mRNA-degrading endonuclease toxin of MazEF toxin-antitoxin module
VVLDVPRLAKTSGPRRGCLYWAFLDKRRPVLVLSPDVRNDRANDVIVVPCTSVLRASPTHVTLRRGEGGVPVSSMMLKCEQIVTLPKSEIGTRALGPPLSDPRVREVEVGVLRAIGIPVPLD